VQIILQYYARSNESKISSLLDFALNIRHTKHTTTVWIVIWKASGLHGCRQADLANPCL